MASEDMLTAALLRPLQFRQRIRYSLLLLSKQRLRWGIAHEVFFIAYESLVLFIIILKSDETMERIQSLQVIVLIVSFIRSVTLSQSLSIAVSVAETLHFSWKNKRILLCFIIKNCFLIRWYWILILLSSHGVSILWNGVWYQAS